MSGMIREFTGAYGFLSNFSLSPLVLADGIEYPTAEHAFQAQKTLDVNERERIARCRTAREAKAAGRNACLIGEWDMVRKRVMSEVVLAKFTQNGPLAAKLNATGEALLVEGNHWHDNFWGSCSCKPFGRCAGVPGLNYLGQILVWARAVLRED